MPPTPYRQTIPTPVRLLVQVGDGEVREVGAVDIPVRVLLGRETGTIVVPPKEARRALRNLFRAAARAFR